MAQILVRNLDDRTAEALKRRAARESKSLEQLVREILAEVASRDEAEFFDAMRRLRASAPKPATLDPTELIREDRDNDQGRC